MPVTRLVTGFAGVRHWLVTEHETMLVTTVPSDLLWPCRRTDWLGSLASFILLYSWQPQQPFEPLNPTVLALAQALPHTARTQASKVSNQGLFWKKKGNYGGTAHLHKCIGPWVPSPAAEEKEEGGRKGRMKNRKEGEPSSYEPRLYLLPTLLTLLWRIWGTKWTEEETLATDTARSLLTELRGSLYRSLRSQSRDAVGLTGLVYCIPWQMAIETFLIRLLIEVMH